MPSCTWGFFSVFLILLQLSVPITAQKSQESPTWQTLSGKEPLVIAKGGFSGLFPDSSQYAYSLALETSLSDVHLWCDVQLTKDGAGICLPDVNLSNCTNIGAVYPKNGKVYPVNGIPISGYFSLDYTLDELSKVSLIQGVFSRTDKFDGSSFILTVEDTVSQFKPPGLWLNIQHDLFYGQHNLSMRSYLLSLSRHIIINYVSSPEVSFLRSIAARFSRSKTKLIFRFPEMDTTEPSTNQTYGALLKNLTFVKTFASGILVPKNYIWPVTADLYLQPHTSIVLDAHKVGLEVFASGFANDNLIAYNYSYDPLSEYLSFVDNGVFSVDGMLSDFPITASEAIGCFSHINKSISGSGRPTIISHNGASGIYPGCTDLAYQQAVDDGADFIDCAVQVTKDNILMCMSSINLIDDTTVVKSPFNTRLSTIQEIQSGSGIFTFNLTWEEIQKNLKPQMENPEYKYGLVRNPSYQNSGNFMKLSDFLAFAKGKALSGVLISIEYAAFLAEKMDFSITDAVIKALHDSGYNNQTVQQVLIQSTNSSVLIKFKHLTDYKLVYKVDETIGDAVSSSIHDIGNFAHLVAINKQSIYPQSAAFITGQTDVVNKFQNANLSVYVYLLRNEFLSQAWDFFSDPIVEINSFIEGAKVNGLITDFPRTASAYRKNTCSKMGDQIPNYMKPVQPGGLLTIMAPDALPPVSVAFAPLSDSNVVEPALPPASLKPSSTDSDGNGVFAPASSPPSSQPRTVASIFLSLAALFGSAMFV